MGWRVVGNANVICSSKCRPIRWGPLYGMCSVITMFPCLRQFNRCPSWFVHQWKQKCFGVVLVPATGSYQREIKDGTKCNKRRLFWYSSSYRMMLLSHFQTSKPTFPPPILFPYYLLSSVIKIFLVNSRIPPPPPRLSFVIKFFLFNFPVIKKVLPFLPQAHF